MRRSLPRLALALDIAFTAALTAVGCGGSSVTYGQPGTLAAFDLQADLTSQDSFWDFPFPSDLRLTEGGTVDWRGFPNPSKLPLVEQIRGIANERKGFSVVPVGYFVFSAPLAAHAQDLIEATADAPVLLIDIDANSPDRGKLFPVILVTPPVDGYVPDNMLAVAARPGFVLHTKRTYAFVVMRALNDAAGKPLGVSKVLDQLRQGVTISTPNAAQVASTYQPLWDTLKLDKIDSAGVAVATVFTTGDGVQDASTMFDGVVAKTSVTIDNLAVDAGKSAGNDRLCRLTGSIQQPQFQVGTPPFNTDGLFALGSDGLPIKQRDETVPIVIALPRMEMPAAGYPLVLYFHGSGGYSNDVVDYGPSVLVNNQPVPTPNRGPGWEHAKNNIASAGSALPVNPERLPGAGETAYLNIANPVALRDTFRQGVIEQRLYLKALLSLQIDPATLGDCGGGTMPTLAGGATKFKFDGTKIIAQGQSMGGMYTNLVSAVEPKIKIAVPTGAGGYWSYFIMQTHLNAGAYPAFLALLLKSAPLTHLHPVLQMLQNGWEVNDPFVAMPRVARMPLPGHPARPIYEPVGKDDEYFPTQLYDAVALSYGHQEAGDPVWPTMQPALKLAGLDGTLSFPVSQNRVSENGQTYTGVVVQYLGDGIEDPHAIYRQLPSVRRQYTCFVKSFLETGIAKVSSPGTTDQPCD
ncbi:MAG: hypothetical protein JST92_09550 [Deltaproteobacteria bacterium]|nr:hypothetical protein [Deltaproteobacteria bacterium]